MTEGRRPRSLTANEVVALLEHEATSEEQAWYLRYNAPRYAWLLDELHRQVAQMDPPADGRLAILDVGAGYQTALLARVYPTARIDTFGWADARFPGSADGRHIAYDLNQAGDPATWPALDGYDLILFAEVIEHLWAGPVGVLRCLARGLTPGGLLLVQTPNAVALHKRLRMAVGRSPVSPMPENSPGQPHLHEYTLSELRDAGDQAGLSLRHVATANYFGGSPLAQVYRRVGSILPRSLRHGMLLVWERTS